MTNCPICGIQIQLNQGTIQGELLECSDCGTELEVTGVKPFTLAQAPQEEEDWGE